jgi:cell division protein FtsL
VNRARRAVWPFVFSVAVVGVLFLLVFPAKTYLAQRRSLAAAGTKVKVLTTENRDLDQRVTALQQPAEIERLAREQYGMVKPGEEAYAILPTPAPPTTVTPPKPPKPQRNIIQRAWHAVF